jgi:hypothetical protein
LILIFKVDYHPGLVLFILAAPFSISQEMIARADKDFDRTKTCCLKGRNAEMTNFTMLPNFSGMDLAQKTLVEIEMNMRVLRIKNPSLENIGNIYPTNNIILKRKYDYAGALIRRSSIGVS